MDEKSGQKFLRSIFNPTHHFVLEWLLSENAVVGNLVGRFWLILVDSSPKLIFGTLRYVKVL